MYKSLLVVGTDNPPMQDMSREKRKVELILSLRESYSDWWEQDWWEAKLSDSGGQYFVAAGSTPKNAITQVTKYLYRNFDEVIKRNGHTGQVRGSASGAAVDDIQDASVFPPKDD